MNETDLTKGIAPLTDVEQETLAVNEVVISEGIATFMEVGKALYTISIGRLYRQTHETFEAYCRERWGFSRQHASRLIEAADVFENVAPMGVIDNERQARAIKHYSKDIQRVVVQIGIKTAPIVNGEPQISATHLKAVGEVVTGILMAGGLDDGSGEMKPLGVLMDAAVTEEVYERIHRQKEIIRSKLRTESRFKPRDPQTAATLPSGDGAPEEGGKAKQPATSELKVRMLLRLVETLIAGIDKEMLDRKTALHPAIYASYHFAKRFLGQESHEETEMRIRGIIISGECDQCGEETQVQDYIFTNTSAQRLSTVPLALCNPCGESYKTLDAA